MMARASAFRAAGLVPVPDRASPPPDPAPDPLLDDIGLSAWVAQAAPGQMLVYHRGFLVIDATTTLSKLAPEQQRQLRETAAAARRAADLGLVHLVQLRLGPDRFAYLAIARPKPAPRGPAFSRRLLAAA